MCKMISGTNTNNSKDIEIKDLILRQILFMFNLELWNKIFIENNDFKNTNLTMDYYL